MLTNDTVAQNCLRLKMMDKNLYISKYYLCIHYKYVSSDTTSSRVASSGSLAAISSSPLFEGILPFHNQI